MRNPASIILAVVLSLACAGLKAEDMSANSGGDSEALGSVRGIVISGNAAYYTYGMDDVNNRFKLGGTNDIDGGAGYGLAVKLGLTQHLAAKVGMDYLFAGRDSSRVVGSTTYNTRVNLPATLLFIGGEYAILPLAVLNLKILGGYTMVNIFNGNEKSSQGDFDFGTVTGSGSGFQAGLGAEVFLSPGFSLQADLAYNYALISNATFAGGPADPSSVNRGGTVDYSGMMAKVAFNIYLFR